VTTLIERSGNLTMKPLDEVSDHLLPGMAATSTRLDKVALMVRP
jgi:hypothetical protein